MSGEVRFTSLDELRFVKRAGQPVIGVQLVGELPKKQMDRLALFVDDGSQERNLVYKVEPGNLETVLHFSEQPGDEKPKAICPTGVIVTSDGKYVLGVLDDPSSDYHERIIAFWDFANMGSFWTDSLDYSGCMLRTLRQTLNLQKDREIIDFKMLGIGRPEDRAAIGIIYRIDVVLSGQELSDHFEGYKNRNMARVAEEEGIRNPVSELIVLDNPSKIGRYGGQPMDYLRKGFLDFVETASSS